MGQINCTERGKHLIICSVLQRCVCPPATFKRARCSNNRIKCLYFCQHLLSSCWRRLYLPNDICGVYRPKKKKQLPTQHCSSCNAGAQCEVSRLQRRLYSLISYRLGRDFKHKHDDGFLERILQNTNMDFQSVQLAGRVAVRLGWNCRSLLSPVCQQRWERMLNVGVCSSRDLCLKRFVLSGIFTLPPPPPFPPSRSGVSRSNMSCNILPDGLCETSARREGDSEATPWKCWVLQQADKMKFSERFDYFTPRLGVDRQSTAALTGGGSPSMPEHKEVSTSSPLWRQNLPIHNTSFTLLWKSQAGVKTSFFFSFTFCHFHRPFSDTML